ncbi:hypothetical protein C487_09508, partial [Natrinema pallidum DSM 3751]
MDIKEAEIEEWVISIPELLNEDLLVVASQYAKFDKTADRPAILALDPDGKLVVIELKRDTADSTTDLQAIKYASYCSTISTEELQQDYRVFWNGRRDGDNQLTPEDVGNKFSEFMDHDVTPGEDGYAEFALDDRPLIMLVSGDSAQRLRRRSSGSNGNRQQSRRRLGRGRPRSARDRRARPVAVPAG